MGKGPSNAEKEAYKTLGEAAKDQVALGKQLAAESAPWRKAAGAEYMKQIYDPWRATSAGQNQIARGALQQTQAVNEAAPGGAREQALRDIGMSTRTQSAQLLNQGYNQAVASIGNLGIGNTQTAVGAYGGASNSAGSLGQLGASQKNGLGGAAAGFGALLGSI